MSKLEDFEKEVALAKSLILECLSANNIRPSASFASIVEVLVKAMHVNEIPYEDILKVTGSIREASRNMGKAVNE